MRIPEFVQFYKDKTDEELIGLTASLGQLTDDARLALEGELSLRGIRVTGASEALRGDSQSRDDFRESTGRLQEAKPQGVGDFLTEVLQTYHSRFWLYFRISAPAVLLSTIAILFSRYEVRELLRDVPRGEIAFNTTKLLGATLLNASGVLPQLEMEKAFVR